MELVSKKKLMLFAGQGNEDLSREIGECLHVPLGEVKLSTFASGELYARYGESIRGADVFIMQSHCEPINDRIMEQLLMIDAAKRASASRITAVCPFYGYARQDRKAEGREPISARLVADLLTVAGADRLVSVDLHTGQIQGFFDGPVDHLTAVPLLADHMAKQVEGDVVVVSPDAGGAKLAKRFSNCLEDAGVESDLAFIDKRRPKGTHNVAEATEVVGNVVRQRLRPHRRHDRHRRHRRVRRQPPRGAGRLRRVGAGHPRRAVRPGRRPAEERPDPWGRGHEHPPDPDRRSASTPSRCSRSPRSSPRPSTPSSRTPASARSSAATTSKLAASTFRGVPDG